MHTSTSSHPLHYHHTHFTTTIITPTPPSSHLLHYHHTYSTIITPTSTSSHPLNYQHTYSTIITSTPLSSYPLHHHDHHRGDTEDDQYCHFYILWALKESYVKAIGLGLGFDLRHVRRIDRKRERMRDRKSKSKIDRLKGREREKGSERG